MELKYSKQEEKLLLLRKKKKRRQKIVRVLAGVVVFCTTYALILPAITMEKTERILTCPVEVHKHDESCYAKDDPEHKLICGKADFIVHEHDTECYDKDGNLVCQLPEIKAHVHDENCYKDVKVQICSSEEGDGHQHTEECYSEPEIVDDFIEIDEFGNFVFSDFSEQDRELICGRQETSVNHTHTESCYEIQNIMVCNNQAVLHKHDQNTCYEKVEHEDGTIEFILTCPELEVLEHKHEEGCFTTVSKKDLEEAAEPDNPEDTQNEETSEETSEDSSDNIQSEQDTPSSEEISDMESSEETLTDTESSEDSEFDKIYEKIFEGADYIVSVKYTDAAEVPEEAELYAEEYAKDSEVYLSRYAEAAQLYGWPEDANYTNEFRLFNIGLYVNGEQIEPSAEVNVTITYKYPQSDEDEEPPAEETSTGSCQVTHFGDDATEILDAQSFNSNGEAIIDFSTDGFSDYGIMLLADTPMLFAAQDNHVCSSDEIAHVSFDGNNEIYWRDDTTDDIGNARFETRTSSSNNNALAEGAANVAPTKTIAGNTHLCSAKMVSTELDYAAIFSNNGYLLKNKGYNEFSFDFWMKPASKNDDSDYGLFEIGSSENGQSRALSATIPKNNNNLNQIILETRSNQKSITINLNESINNQWVHVFVTYEGSKATLWVENTSGQILGQGTLDTTMTVPVLFGKGSTEIINFANVENTRYFNGFVDEIIIRNRALDAPEEEIIHDGTNHPKTSVTREIKATGVGLYNVNTKGGTAGPLAGVEYTVYDANGNLYGTYVTGNEYVLQLGILPPGTYTIEQTGVPDGYIIVPQTKTFTVSSNADNLTQAGLFYDYCDIEGYNPDKTAEVYDYPNRIYDIVLSAKSGRFENKIEPKNFNFVVDQSNSMLFPAVLTDTGARVELHSVSDGNDSTTFDATGNSARLDAVMNNSGLDPNRLYYIKALDATKATVYAIWKSSNGHWYAQDAAYYAQAQMGVHHVSEARNYMYSDTNNENDTKVVDGGGCLDGINRASENQGNSINGMADLWADIQDFGTVNTQVSYTRNNTVNYDHYKNYVIYTGSDMNRLTYLKYAIKRLVYQLAAMDSKNQVTITGFDKQIEGCITREVDASNPQGVIDLITYVDGIQTSGGTAQNYGIAHILGDHATNGNKTSCPGNHLNYTADGQKASDYIVLITDGALNNSNGNRVYSSSDSGANEEEKQALDLKAGATKFKTQATDPKLITIGLSVHDVTWAQTLLAGESNGGIATDGYSFLDIDADQLSIILSNTLLGQLIKLEKKDDNADIRDYISESFYPVAPDGNVLTEGQWLTLEGIPVNAGDASAAGQLLKDDKGWYVEWKNQPLGLGTDASTVSNTTYIYYADTNLTGEGIVVNPSIKYALQWVSGGSHRVESTGKDILEFNSDTGRWQFRWANSNNTITDASDHIKVVTNEETTEASPRWTGKIYVKAKEDFIGGNTIDTNKGPATITLIRDDGYDRDLIELPTPTVNVRLLPMNQVHSEETVFLGDNIEDVKNKIRTLLDQIYFTKIISNGDDVHNKTNAAGNTQGLKDATFDLRYAAGDLTSDQWDALFAGESIEIPYTYDAPSSHGAVGNFVITLTKTGAGSDYNNHQANETGMDVEKYTLNVTYNAERIVDAGTRPTDVHNYGNGPGTEVGTGAAPQADENLDDALKRGYGTVPSVNEHHVHVIDGEIFLTKVIDESLISDQDQVYTFDFYIRDPETGESAADAIRTVTVTVPAGQTQGTTHIDDLSRNNYTVKESISSDYVVTNVEVVNGDTTCKYETVMPALEFDIGTNMMSNGTNPDHNVIIFNETLPNYENSMWVNGKRYVYSKPFKNPGTDSSDSESDSTYPRPGYHLENREVEVYAWESGTIISQDTSGDQYTKLDGTTAGLDGNYTSYGVLTQNPYNEDDWTITWTNWTRKSEDITTYDWPEGTLISTDTSGSQYTKLNGTTASLDASHTSYGILTKNSSGNWVIEWHTWTSKTEYQTTPGTTTYQPVTLTYYQTRTDDFSTYKNNDYYYKDGNNYKLITNITDNWQLTITTSDGTVYNNLGPTTSEWSGTLNDNVLTYEYIYKKITTGGTTTPVTTWSVATSTVNADTSKLPTTTNTNTSWTKETSTAPADNTKIPKTTKTIQVEVEDKPEESDPETGTIVDSVTITKLSAGHGVITNSAAGFEADIPVKKKWDDKGAHVGDIVYVVLVNQDGSPVTDDEGTAKLLKLDSAHGFTGSFTVPIPNRDFDPIKDGHYEIREVNKIQETEFTDSIRAMLTENQSDTTVYYVALAAENTLITINENNYNVHYTTDEDKVLVAENHKAYELPHTGGMGTLSYTLGGLFLICTSLLYGFSLRRKRERRIR